MSTHVNSTTSKRPQKPLQVGFILFPGITQLDLTGPAEVFAAARDVAVNLFWKDKNPVRTNSGWSIVPTATYDEAPQLDVLCVPGGPGQIDLMDDEDTIRFIQEQAKGASYVTSVCTGSLLLGAAGLLDGYEATCHWMSLEQLSLFGAKPQSRRVVVDRKLITAAGVSAGIDFALLMLSLIFGDDLAKSVQLSLEYSPVPPFNSGHPDTAARDIVDTSRNTASARQERRLAASCRAATRMPHP